MASQAMQPGQPLDKEGRYVFIKELGRGSFGCIVLAQNTATREQVAIKRMAREHLARYVESEILNHSKLRHPHVVQFREVFLSAKHINIVMDYANAGSLFQYVQGRGRLREALARWFFQQLVLAVDYVHKKGVAHRDIKLENTLLQQIPGLPRPLVKICDLGYAKNDDRSAAHSKVGTLTYMAPEILFNPNTNGIYDGKKADIWSMGVVLYTMLVGRYPFDAPQQADATMVEKLKELRNKMCNREYSLPEHLQLSLECRDLLAELLHPDSTQRVTIEGIMAHPWFRADLPQDALTMNSRYLASSKPCSQSDDDIRRIMQQAMRIRGSDTLGGYMDQYT